MVAKAREGARPPRPPLNWPMIVMPEKDEYIKFKNYERKIKLPFMIYADFESIVVPEDNGEQNPKESYKRKCQKHISCSYGYKLVCVDDKFIKPFNPKKAGFFEGSFFWEFNLTPLSYFKKNLFNINIILYNCLTIYNVKKC